MLEMMRIRNFNEVYKFFGQDEELLKKLINPRSLKRKSPEQMDRARRFYKRSLEKLLGLNPYLNSNGTYSDIPRKPRSMKEYIKIVRGMARLLAHRNGINERLVKLENELTEIVDEFIKKYNLHWSRDDMLRAFCHPSLYCGVCHPWIFMNDNGESVYNAYENRKKLQVKRKKILENIRNYDESFYGKIVGILSKLDETQKISEREEVEEQEENWLINMGFNILCPHPYHRTIEDIARCPNVERVRNAIVYNHQKA
ncbi:MAG: hypothetical protein ACTSV6_06270 [Candidatus Heimdallarchaeota archaeon]